MIPRVIHYCWFSDDPIPPRLQACIDSWGRVLQGYELKLWNFKTFPRGKSKWVDEAFDMRKYAFAADYIRAYALFHEGGIYLDSDVEAVRPFDDLLHLPYFMCAECGSNCIEAAAMGSEAGNLLFARLLARYDSRSFIKEDGTPDMVPMPVVIGQEMENAGLRRVDIDSVAEFDDSADVVNVLPYDFFSPINIENLELRRTDRTYCIHYFAGTWRTPYKRFKKDLQRVLGPAAAQWVINAKRRVLRILGRKDR